MKRRVLMCSQAIRCAWSVLGLSLFLDSSLGLLVLGSSLDLLLRLKYEDEGCSSLGLVSLDDNKKLQRHHYSSHRSKVLYSLSLCGCVCWKFYWFLVVVADFFYVGKASAEDWNPGWTQVKICFLISVFVLFVSVFTFAFWSWVLGEDWKS